MIYKGTGMIISKFKGNALFYKLKVKLPVNVIHGLYLCEPETIEQVPEHWEAESHWLADWDFHSSSFFDIYREGDELEVEFQVKSTRYNPNMKHGDSYIGPCRNLNITMVTPL